jgi:acetylornithine deacetylase/succinyl-diaminopimelate desuccinylase-like protein
LRGVKYLLQKGKYKDRIKQFIAVDGTGEGTSIANGGVGSKRYRVTFKGPGGHSYGAFGLVNPAFAMGAAMQKLSAIQVPQTPKTTFNVGVVGGGHVGELDSVRDLDGSGHAIGVAGRARETRDGIPDARPPGRRR